MMETVRPQRGFLEWYGAGLAPPRALVYDPHARKGLEEFPRASRDFVEHVSC